MRFRGSDVERRYGFGDGGAILGPAIFFSFIATLQLIVTVMETAEFDKRRVQRMHQIIGMVKGEAGEQYLTSLAPDHILTETDITKIFSVGNEHTLVREYTGQKLTDDVREVFRMKLVEA